jgi:hypothetical protein
MSADAIRLLAALWSNHHKNSFSPSAINGLRVATINERRSRRKPLNSRHNLRVWWRLLHNAAYWLVRTGLLHPGGLRVTGDRAVGVRNRDNRGG